MLDIKTQPAALLTTAEVKTYLTIDHSEDDALIGQLINRATAYLDGPEGYMGRALVSQVWYQTVPAFSSIMKIELGPVVSVDAITYLDPDGVSQTVAGESYYSHRDDRWTFVEPLPGNSWPTSVSARKDAVKIEFTAGWASSDPRLEAIKQGAAMLIGHFMQNTSAVENSPHFKVPMGVEDILAPFRIML